MHCKIRAGCTVRDDEDALLETWRMHCKRRGECTERGVCTKRGVEDALLQKRRMHWKRYGGCTVRNEEDALKEMWRIHC